MGISPVPRNPDGVSRGLVPGPGRSLFDSAASGGRPFGHCAGAQERSRRIVRLGRTCPRRHWDLATSKASTSGVRHQSRRVARRSLIYRILRKCRVANGCAHRLSTPLSTKLLRWPAGRRNRRPPLASEGGLRAIEDGGRRRGSHGALQGFPQPLQVNRAVPRARQCECRQKQRRGNHRGSPRPDERRKSRVGHLGQTLLPVPPGANPTSGYSRHFLAPLVNGITRLN
jgi:hypothetical protein